MVHKKRLAPTILRCRLLYIVVVGLDMLKQRSLRLRIVGCSAPLASLVSVWGLHSQPSHSARLRSFHVLPV